MKLDPPQAALGKVTMMPFAATPTKPADLEAPGCRPRPGVVYWLARKDLADRGYAPKSGGLWTSSPGHAGPAPEQWENIPHEGHRLQPGVIFLGGTKKVNTEPARAPA